MRTYDHSFLGRAALVLAATILVSVTAAGRQTPAMPPTHQMGADSMHSMKSMTTAQKIATAMTAGPYVMYAGTPYAHMMAPTTDAAMSGKSR